MEVQNISTRGSLARSFHLLFFPLAILVYLTGYLFEDLTVMYLGMATLFTVNIVYACEQLHQRFVFLFFHTGLFLFLISRPTIAFFRGENLQALTYSFEAACFALNLLVITMVFLRIGSALAENLQGIREKKRSNQPALLVSAKRLKDNPKLPSLRIAAGLLFVISWAALFWYGYLKMQTVQGLSYMQFYLTDFSGTGSLVERTLATFEPIALCAFLAALPSKRMSLIVLIMHLLTTLSTLAIGGRSEFVLAALFIVVYYGFRDITDGKGSWIGRFEKLALLICIPVGLVAMGMFNYIREHNQATTTSLVDTLVDAIDKQGVSYYVMGRAYAVTGDITHLGFKGYSFGGLTDYILHGPFGTYILHNPSLPAFNSVPLAVEGTSYAHTMSYFAHWGYLQGHGYGSSYLLELNQDFGLGGVAVFSVILGFVLNYMPYLFKRNWLWGTIVLMMCTVLFHVPRGETLEWVAYLWTPQFWLAIALIVGGAAILRAKRFQGSIINKENAVSFLGGHENLGEINEHSKLLRSVWYRQTKNRSDSDHSGHLRWAGSCPRTSQ